jgi:hypothetical protein
MNGSIRALAVGAALAAGAARPAAGQTLGEMLDRGARLQDRAQLVELFSGRMLGTTSPLGDRYLMLAFDRDGTLSGTVWALRGPDAGSNSRVSGTWSARDDGLLCTNETLHDWRLRQAYCTYVLLTDDRLIYSGSTTDRSRAVTVRRRSDLR